MYNKITPIINESKNENSDEIIAEKITQFIKEPLEKLKGFENLEKRLMNYIIDLEGRIVKLRQDISPYELSKSIKAKADSTAVVKLIEDSTVFHEQLITFQKKVEKDLSKFAETLKKVLPIFYELKATTALRQSNCLVCGRKASSPNLERKVNSSMEANEAYSPKANSINVGRNHALLKKEICLNTSSEIRPSTAGKTTSKNKISKNMSLTSKERNTVVMRNEIVYSANTYYSQHKKYKLPLGYQLMNERHKEGALNTSQSISRANISTVKQ